MDFKFKEEILLDIGPEPNCNDESESNRYYDKIEEIDHVYTQAAKVDEYEAKAKAYDDIRYAVEMQTAIGVSDEDTLIDIEHVIISLLERREGGGSDD